MITRGYYEQSYPPSVFAGGGGGLIDPHIDSLAPTTGVAGAEVTLVVTGVRFDAGAVVEVDQVAVPTVVDSPTQVTATFTPASAGAKTVTVRNANDQESNSAPFTVTAAVGRRSRAKASTPVEATDEATDEAKDTEG